MIMLYEYELMIILNNCMIITIRIENVGFVLDFRSRLNFQNFVDKFVN